MKKKGPAGKGRDRRQKIRPLAAFLLAAALILTAVQIPGVTARAEAVDLTKECSLTVVPIAGAGDGGLTEAMAIDLYRVADAEAVSGYDTYQYEVKENYANAFEGALDRANLASLTQERWKELAQAAAGIALDSADIQPDASASGTAGAETIEIETDANGNPLSPGLYLIIARQAQPAGTSGADGEDAAGGGNTETLPDEGDTQEPAGGGDIQEPDAGGDADTPTGGGDAKLTTQVRTEHYIYTFEPQLISIPGKAPDPTTGEVRIDGPGDWIYDMQVTLKSTQETRLGSLEIVKTVEDQSLMTDPVTFVFRVSAYLDKSGDDNYTDDELVYSNVVGMTFTGAGEQRVTLADQIPAGTHVLVEEVYSGASYEISGDALQVGEVAADELLSLTFTNRGNDRHRGGHGIVNSFTYGTGGWTWSADPAQADTE